MDRIKLCLFALMALLLFTSCEKEEKVLSISMSPPELTLNELTTSAYSEEQLNQIILLRGKTIDEINQKYPIECIRKTQVGYRIAYVGEDSNILLLSLDDSGSVYWGNIYVTAKTKTEFEAMNETTVDDMLEFDPGGEFLFLYTGKSDTPKNSTHCSTDGYLITICYDESNNICGMEYELI